MLVKNWKIPRKKTNQRVGENSKRFRKKKTTEAPKNPKNE